MSEDNSVDFVELDWPSKTSEVRRISLPFQTVETVNEPRVDAPTLFSGRWPEGYPKDWKNKLIWGDNRYVMGSLHDELAGEIDLIYIDPPFATGSDFTYEIQVGEKEVAKERNVIEEIAYRDTWEHGLSSYLQMLYDRLVLMRKLLASHGTIFVHLDWRVGHHVRLLLDEVFGQANYLNTITWRRQIPRGMKVYASHFANSTDCLLMYGKNAEKTKWNRVTREKLISLEEARKKFQEDDRGFFRTSAPGTYSDESLKELHQEGRIYVSKGGDFVVHDDGSVGTTKGSIYVKYYRERRGDKVVIEKTVDNLWDDIPGMGITPQEYLGFPTQKVEALLERVLSASSDEGDLVADFFCGSGTTGAVAEKMGRRWIMADLSKYAVQTSRKRMLNIHRDHSSYDQPGRPFQVLNMGNYQKHKFIENGHPPVEEYQEFVLELYSAQPVEAGVLIHGRRANDFVHIASVDSVVTIWEIEDCVEELQESVGGESLHILGWDFALGLGEDLSRLKASTGVDIQCKKIPDEAVELERAEDARDRIKFYDLNYFEADLAVNDRRVSVTLEDFMLANPEFLPDEAREAISDFSDYIDYWAVDFDNHGDTFHNMWQSFRTEEDSSLDLRASYTYDEPGQYRVLVKVIDVFGNDTTQVFEVEVS